MQAVVPAVTPKGGLLASHPLLAAVIGHKGKGKWGQAGKRQRLCFKALSVGVLLCTVAAAPAAANPRRSLLPNP